MKNLRLLECRKNVPILTKYRIIELGTNLTNERKEKEYDYMICDYCNEEIKIEDDIAKKTGGTINIKITKARELTIASHNKCLKSLLREINKTYRIEL